MDCLLELGFKAIEGTNFYLNIKRKHINEPKLNNLIMSDANLVALANNADFLYDD